MEEQNGGELKLRTSNGCIIGAEDRHQSWELVYGTIPLCYPLLAGSRFCVQVWDLLKAWNLFALRIYTTRDGLMSWHLSNLPIQVIVYMPDAGGCATKWRFCLLFFGGGLDPNSCTDKQNTKYTGGFVFRCQSCHFSNCLVTSRIEKMYGESVGLSDALPLWIRWNLLFVATWDVRTQETELCSWWYLIECTFSIGRCDRIMSRAKYDRMHQNGSTCLEASGQIGIYMSFGLSMPAHRQMDSKCLMRWGGNLGSETRKTVMLDD